MTGGVVMRALVVYESMFGNTHTVASHIADGLRWRHECAVCPVGDVTHDLLETADLLVVGGPTHVHGMSSSTSRSSAVDMAVKDDDLDLDPDAEGPGLRDWFTGLPNGLHRAAAAFDTRIDASTAFTGRASKGIGKRLHRHGYRLLVEPESFLVDKQNHLIEGEEARSEEWGKELAAELVAHSVR
jgi:flavodoxin